MRPQFQSFYMLKATSEIIDAKPENVKKRDPTAAMRVVLVNPFEAS
jgi:hypothetical protein